MAVFVAGVGYYTFLAVFMAAVLTWDAVSQEPHFHSALLVLLPLAVLPLVSAAVVGRAMFKGTGRVAHAVHAAAWVTFGAATLLWAAVALSWTPRF